jgi:hypothetical protein
MKTNCLLTAVALLTCVATESVLAQSETDSAARVARDVRRDARDARRDAQVTRLLARDVQPEQPVADLTVGVAAARAEDDGHVVSTPIAFGYQTAGKTEWWKFELKGDGYVKVRTPDAPSASGLGDLAFNVYHWLSPQLIGGLGLGIPSHGEVGSRDWSENAKLVFHGDFGSSRWSYLLIGIAAHLHGAAAGTGSVSEALYGELDYNIGDRQTMLVNLSRGHQRGARGVTVFGLEYDFPIAKKWDGKLGASRGLTRGARDTGVEFDVTYTF